VDGDRVAGLGLGTVTRREFLDLLGHYNVSEFDDTMDVAAEAMHG